MVDKAAQIWRDYVTDGVPASGAKKPEKAKIREWGTVVEGYITAFNSNGGLIYTTLALMNADLLHGVNSSAWVIGDPNVANNGIYRKIGASGTGSWTRVADLPYTFISCTDAGAGTANALILTSAIPAPSASRATIFICSAFEANTGAVTIALNGAAAKPLVSMSGLALAGGYLTSGTPFLFLDNGDNYQLITDVVSSGIVEAAAASAAAASASAASASASAAGVNLPPILSGDAFNILSVKSNETGYELVDKGTTDVRSSDPQTPANGRSIIFDRYDGLTYKITSDGRIIPLNGNMGTKPTPYDYTNKTVLWLGTSIPETGGATSYPQLVRESLGCGMVNNSFGGSHAFFDSTTNPFPTPGVGANAGVRALSMTEADRVALLALHGAGSIYDDAFDATALASQMTADYRIKAAFTATVPEVVILDHNRNDISSIPSGAGFGSETDVVVKTVGTIAKGATTIVQVVGGTAGIAAGDAVILSESVGITKLNYAAARVVSVGVGNPNNIHIAIDSSTFVGMFSGPATLTKVNRATVWGAFRFIISYIRWCSALNGQAVLPIIFMANSPSYWDSVVDGGPYKREFTQLSWVLKDIARFHTIGFFDAAGEYGIGNSVDNIRWLADGVHPTGLAARQAMANHWTQWLSGGAFKHRNDSRVLLTTAAEIASITSDLNTKRKFPGVVIRDETGKMFVCGNTSTPGATWGAYLPDSGSNVTPA